MLAAAIVTFGRHPDWAQFSFGLSVICMTRRFQWPLLTFCAVLCLALFVLVLAGKRKGGWLVGLLPVGAMLGFRFALDPLNALQVVEQPPMVTAQDATFISDQQWVVGLMINGQPIAFPYHTLFRTPVVLHQEFDKRVLLVWSAFSNRGVAFEIDRDYRARDLDIVSIPANALLIYNTRLGEFMNGATGLTRDGKAPTGIRLVVPVTHTLWSDWKTRHPSTRVMGLLQASDQTLPAAPVLPRYALPDVPSALRNDQSIVFIQTSPPVALLSTQVTTSPLNLKSGSQPFVVFRDAAGTVRAFDRRLDDLTPRFTRSPVKRGAASTTPADLLDSDTQTTWSEEGRSLAASGDMKGAKLRPLIADENVYWGVMKYWFPDLEPYTDIKPPNPAD